MDRSKLLGYGVLALGLAGSLVFLAGLLIAIGAGSPALGIGILVVGLAGLVAALCLSGRYPIHAEISTDQRQSQWASSLAAMPIALVVLGFLAGDGLWHMGMGHDVGKNPYLRVYLPMAVASISHMTWYWQYGWRRDELIRSYYSNALSWGFVAALVGLFGLMGLAMVSLRYAVTGLPVLAALMLLVVGVRLWWQVRQADNG